MYMVFNVDGKSISSSATPTIVPYNLATYIVLNSHATPAIILS